MLSVVTIPHPLCSCSVYSLGLQSRNANESASSSALNSSPDGSRPSSSLPFLQISMGLSIGWFVIWSDKPLQERLRSRLELRVSPPAFEEL